MKSLSTACEWKRLVAGLGLLTVFMCQAGRTGMCACIERLESVCRFKGRLM